jgi:hypothetical protein
MHCVSRDLMVSGPSNPNPDPTWSLIWALEWVAQSNQTHFKISIQYHKPRKLLCTAISKYFFQYNQLKDPRLRTILWFVCVILRTKNYLSKVTLNRINKRQRRPYTFAWWSSKIFNVSSCPLLVAIKSGVPRPQSMSTGTPFERMNSVTLQLPVLNKMIPQVVERNIEQTLLSRVNNQ